MAFFGLFIFALRFFDNSRGYVKGILSKNELKIRKKNKKIIKIENKGENGKMCYDLDNPVVSNIYIDGY